MSDFPRAAMEAILFVTEAPVSSAELAQVLEVPTRRVEEELRSLAEELEASGRGFMVRAVAGGWRMYTAPEARPYLERFAATERASRLSGAALEALAVVAYQQPVSRGQVSEIRGVDSERALRTLEARGLVREVGRSPGPGQAVLYGTTELFLEKMGMDELVELPPLGDHVPPADVVEALERPFREPVGDDG